VTASCLVCSEPEVEVFLDAGFDDIQLPFNIVGLQKETQGLTEVSDVGV